MVNDSDLRNAVFRRRFFSNCIALDLIKLEKSVDVKVFTAVCFVLFRYFIRLFVLRAHKRRP